MFIFVGVGSEYVTFEECADHGSRTATNIYSLYAQFAAQEAKKNLNSQTLT